jgi:hypothetical protein
MFQRTKKQTRVRVHCNALVASRDGAAKVAGGRTASGNITTVPAVLGEWIDGVFALRSAKTPAERVAIAERLAGKPLVLPVVTP